MARRTSTRRYLLTLLAGVGLVVVAACGDTAETTVTTEGTEATAEPPPTTATTATTAPTASSTPPTTLGEPPTTTTAAPTTTTTAAPTTTTTAATTTTVDVNTLADGSGCTPGGGDLPDGFWFGYVEVTTAATIEFDLACWFTGEAATLAAAQDGEESPPPNDYHIRNGNPLIRTVPVAPGADASWMTNPGDPSTTELVTYDFWIANRDGRGWQPGVWLLVESGVVSLVEEQYQP